MRFCHRTGRGSDLQPEKEVRKEKETIHGPKENGNECRERSNKEGIM